MRRTACQLVLVLSVLAWRPGPSLANTVPAELGAQLPAAVLAGQSKFTFWGFDVYHAALWVQPGFTGEDYARHAFALELAYLRDFSNEEITNRSLQEMQRQAGGLLTTSEAWRKLLRSAFPDVRKGDRILGIHRPGDGVTFLTNGKITGVVRDPDFARRFFGIWLAADTSEPRLRAALLSRVAAR